MAYDKAFTVAPPINAQNIVSSSTKKRNVGTRRLLRTCQIFSHGTRSSLATGLHRLFFVEPGVNANGVYYRDVLLMQKVLPVIRHMSGNFFVFQQDSAPAHRVRDTIALLRRETAELIGPELWPAKSPDLNPVDHNICGLI